MIEPDIIENGVKFEQLGLVHFIRHLPKLTDQEIEKMKKMNPQPAVKPHKH